MITYAFTQGEPIIMVNRSLDHNNLTQIIGLGSLRMRLFLVGEIIWFELVRALNAVRVIGQIGRLLTSLDVGDPLDTSNQFIVIKIRRDSFCEGCVVSVHEAYFQVVKKERVEGEPTKDEVSSMLFPLQQPSWERLTQWPFLFLQFFLSR